MAQLARTYSLVIIGQFIASTEISIESIEISTQSTKISKPFNNVLLLKNAQNSVYKLRMNAYITNIQGM